MKNDTYHGSNSWIILSKRITANRREANPEIHANSNTANVIKLLQPAVFLLVAILFELFIVSQSIQSNNRNLNRNEKKI